MNEEVAGYIHPGVEVVPSEHGMCVSGCGQKMSSPQRADD